MVKKTKRSKSRLGRAKAIRRPAHSSPEPIEVIARGCLVEGSRVLLCRNIKHGYLYFPGGHVDFGESAAAALQREFLEECALPVRVGSLALVSEGAFPTRKRKHHEINLVFHVERTGGGAKPILSQEEGIAFEWMELAAVPDADIRPTAAKAWLASGGPGQGVEWVSEFSHSA